jgi:hypothetical protein
MQKTSKIIFNYRLSRAWRVIENTFGILTTKFWIFRRAILAKPDKVGKIAKATCCLRNYLWIYEMQNSASNCFYCPPGYIDREDTDGNIIPGNWRLQNSGALQSTQHLGSNTYSSTAANLRDTLRDFMVSHEGEVSW